MRERRPAGHEDHHLPVFRCARERAAKSGGPEPVRFHAVRHRQHGLQLALRLGDIQLPVQRSFGMCGDVPERGGPAAYADVSRQVHRI